MGRLFSMRVGHKKDQFFLQKEEFIISVYYDREKCLERVEQLNKRSGNEGNTKTNELD